MYAHRMLNVALLALVVAGPAPAPSKKPTPTPYPSHSTLKTHCLVWAGDPRNPWALAHGIKAFGPQYKASDGRLAADVIIKDFLLRNEAFDGGAETGGRYGFQRYARDKTPIEPHTNLNVKALLTSGVPLTQRFSTSWGGTVTLGELVDSVHFGFRHVPQVEAYWKDVGWTLDILAATTPQGGTVQTGAGPVKLDQVMNDALDYLEKANADIKEGMFAGKRFVPKRRQGVYGHSCGAMHLIQPVLSWARHPAVKKAWGHRVQEQIDILFYRLQSERLQYDQALQAGPEYHLPVLAQMVKFYGHWLETMGRLKKDLGFKPDANQQILINMAKALLDYATGELKAMDVFAKPDRLRTNPETYQQYLDLIGDSCHAYHGLLDWP